MEDDQSLSFPSASDATNNHNNHGWQKVTYAKKHRKNHPTKTTSDSSGSDKNAAFKGLEQQSEERQRKLEAQRASTSVYDDDDDVIPARSRRDPGEDDGEDDYATTDAKENKPKKDKPKKVKKPKVTVSEAAAKIEADDLAAFLSSVAESFERQADIQMMRFADYFGRAFAAVSSSQFPWLKLFRESPLSKIADTPVSYISESVYKTSVDWISQRPNEALGSIVLWSLYTILADLAAQLLGSKGSKKGVNQGSSKSQVAIFLVMALVLRRKPDVLISLVPKLRENPKYQGQDRLPILVWMVVQVCKGDLALGLYLWAHLVLPVLGGKAGSNPQCRDLVLQLVERILSTPKARGILINGAVRKGERLIPPAALELLLRVTFPAKYARFKSTERFEAVYPILKEVALAGSPGSKAMKQVSLQIQTVAVKAAEEGIPALSQEATSIFLWCLTQSPDCYKQWDTIYEDNIEVSLAALRKLSEEWKTLSFNQSSLQELARTLKSFREKNAKALDDEDSVDGQDYFRDADKYCKAILGRLSSGRVCLKAIAFIIVVVGVGAAFVSPDLDALDWNNLSGLFNAHPSL